MSVMFEDEENSLKRKSKVNRVQRKVNTIKKIILPDGINITIYKVF